MPVFAEFPRDTEYIMGSFTNHGLYLLQQYASYHSVPEVVAFFPVVGMNTFVCTALLGGGENGEWAGR